MKSPNLLSLGVLASVVTAGLSSCTKESSSNAKFGIQPASNVAASPNASDSFASARSMNLMPSASASPSPAKVGDIGPGTDQDEVVIKKSALEKEFLFFGNQIPQTQEPTSHGLKGRVVAFRRQGDSVYMLEATQGHVVSTSLPSTLLLATFPILKETSDSLLIDFNHGMGQVYTDGAWYGSDMSGKTYQDTTTAEGITQSFVESVALVGNSLEIRQIAQVPEPSTNTNDPGTDFNSYEFRYYIQPYLPNPNYSPRETSDFSRVGFFEVNPQVEASSGRTTTRITTWDLSKPVTYAISSNTPKEFHDAVKEGVLYWNQVFGKEVVKVIDAPKGVTAPDPQYNVIQWVEDNAAGFAYADGLADPRSGEMLHAQIFLTSVFGVDGTLVMPKYIREMPLLSTTQPPKNSAGQLHPAFMESAELCERPFDTTIPQTVTQLRSKGVTDPSVYLRTGQDYVRVTVAHEVGHTLGLRHNFAGSLASTASVDQVDQMFDAYILNDTPLPSDQHFTSSVMEYDTFEEDVLHSSAIKQQKLVLPYDKIAMQWGYFGTPIDDSNTPLFCSDGQEGKPIDCLTFDQGSEPVVANMMTNRRGLSLLPASIVEQYIQAKAPTDPRDAIPLANLPLDPTATAATYTGMIKSQIAWLAAVSATPSIRTERLFPFATSFYQSEMDSSQQDFVAKQFGEAGGVKSVLFQLLPQSGSPSLTDTASAALDTYLARSDVRSGLGWDGKTNYSLSDSDVALISANGKKFIKQLQAQMASATLDLLDAGSYQNSSLSQEIESDLTDLAKAILLTQTTQVIKGSPISVAAPSPGLSPQPSASPAPSSSSSNSSKSTQPALAYQYSKDLRIKAAKLLFRSPGNRSDWMSTGREDIGGAFAEYLTSVFGGDPTQVDPESLSPEMRTWLQDQLDLLGLIANSDKS